MSLLPQRAEGRFRLAGVLILAGLVVELLSLWEAHPFTFLSFSFLGAAPVALGILLYLWTVLRRPV